MANYNTIKISELQQAQEIQGDELTVVVQSGDTKKSTISDIKEFIIGDEKIELMVSVPYIPDANSTIFYQQLPTSTFIDATAVTDGVNINPVIFNVFLDNVSVGDVTFDGGIAIINITMDTVSDGDILEIRSQGTPIDNNLTNFAFTFNFKRG